MPKCKSPACDNEVPEGKKYCSKECYYNRNLPVETETLPVGISVVPDGAIPLDEEEIIDPFEEQLAKEGIIRDDEDVDTEHWCPVCGSRKINGRCVNFTQHPAPKKPRSR